MNRISCLITPHFLPPPNYPSFPSLSPPRNHHTTIILDPSFTPLSTHTPPPLLSLPSPYHPYPLPSSNYSFLPLSPLPPPTPQRPSRLSYLEAVDGVGCVAGDVADAVGPHPRVLALHKTILVLGLVAVLVVGEFIVGHRETELVRLRVELQKAVKE